MSNIKATSFSELEEQARDYMVECLQYSPEQADDYENLIETVIQATAPSGEREVLNYAYDNVDIMRCWRPDSDRATPFNLMKENIADLLKQHLKNNKEKLINEAQEKYLQNGADKD